MIHEVSGDILLSRAKVIAHGVGGNDDFKQGLALSLRERYPSLYKDFRHYCHSVHPKAGELWVWSGMGETEHITVVNLFTQSEASPEGGHAGKAHLSDVNHALRALHKLIEAEKFTSLALPRLATGVGGLAWTDVLPLIKQHLGALQIPVYLYSTYRPGVVAEEK
jgi:O-acetyl-ADP-ribose deacetylase (regulator of RNase III)